MTVTRYFRGLVRSQVEHLSAVLWQFTAGRLQAPGAGRGVGFTLPSLSATGISKAV
jgi:hypothetical protein